MRIHIALSSIFVAAVLVGYFEDEIRSGIAKIVDSASPSASVRNEATPAASPEPELEDRSIPPEDIAPPLPSTPAGGGDQPMPGPGPTQIQPSPQAPNFEIPKVGVPGAEIEERRNEYLNRLQSESGAAPTPGPGIVSPGPGGGAFLPGPNVGPSRQVSPPIDPNQMFRPGPGPQTDGGPSGGLPLFVPPPTGDPNEDDLADDVASDPSGEELDSSSAEQDIYDEGADDAGNDDFTDDETDLDSQDDPDAIVDDNATDAASEPSHDGV